MIENWNGCDVGMNVNDASYYMQCVLCGLWADAESLTIARQLADDHMHFCDHHNAWSTR